MMSPTDAPFFWQFQRKRERNQTIMALVNIIAHGGGDTYEAARNLNNIGYTRLVMPIVKTMLENPDREARHSASYAFIYMNNRFAIPYLMQVLNNENELDEVRGHAAEALAQLQYKKAIPQLIQLLQAESIRLKWEAIFALSCFADQQSIPALKHIAATDHRASLDPDNKTLAEQAQEALDTIAYQIQIKRKAQREKLLNWLILVLPAIYLYWRRERFFPTRF